MRPVTDTPVGPLLTTVFTSILEVFLLCLSGYVLAWRGILDRRTQKQLNRLNVSLFTPSLLFSKVAFFLSPAKLRELWIIPMFFVLVTTVSMIVSFLLGWMFQLKRSQRSFAMAAAMFMNSNSLPIALMQSLVLTVPGLKWGDNDNLDAMVGRALTYLVLYSTFGMVLRWSYGVRLLSQADPDPVSLPSTSITAPQDATMPELIRIEADGDFDAEDEDRTALLSDVVGEDSNDQNYDRPPHPKHSSFFRSFPNSPGESRKATPPHSPVPDAQVAYTSQSSSEEDTDDDLATLPHHHRRRNGVIPPTSSRFESFVRRSQSRMSKMLHTFNEFMTVPLWASLASLVVACIQPFQHTLELHMQPVKGALASAGDCSIPLTLVVLGGYFYTPPEEPTETPEQRQSKRWSLSTVKSSASLMSNVKDMFKMNTRRGERTNENGLLAASGSTGKPGETKTVVIAVVSRMILTPLLLLPLIALSTKFDLQSVFDDPVFVVTNVILISSPPALTLAQITQAASGDAFERLISRTIFWSYCILTPPITILCVVLGLILAKL